MVKQVASGNGQRIAIFKSLVDAGKQIGTTSSGLHNGWHLQVLGVMSDYLRGPSMHKFVVSVGVQRRYMPQAEIYAAFFHPNAEAREAMQNMGCLYFGTLNNGYVFPDGEKAFISSGGWKNLQLGLNAKEFLDFSRKEGLPMTIRLLHHQYKSLDSILRESKHPAIYQSK